MCLLYRPNGYYENVFSIDWNVIKKRGCDYILVDADNTLFSHGNSFADQKVLDLIRRIEDLGIKVILCSNAKLPRAEKIANSLKIDFVDSCRKPLPKRINQFLAERKYDRKAVVIVGDQIFTDILVAKYVGIRSILVKPLTYEEPFYIRIKRLFEKFYFSLADIRGFYNFN